MWRKYIYKKELAMPVTGVICQGSIDPEKLTEIYDKGIDLGFLQWEEENPKADPMEYEDMGDTIILYGFKKNKKTKLYEPDPRVEISCILSTDYGNIQIVKSKWIAEDARRCSPCYPNQADLDSKGGGICGYTFGPDWFSDENPPTCKPVFIRKGA
jgi:hypothetical protein